MGTKNIRYVFSFLPDKLYLKICYRMKIGKKLNIIEPSTFNEKMQWLKLYNRNPLYTTLVDKYKVREYVKDKTGEEYLIPMVGGPWERFEDIDFSALPEKFVLKCNHDSGSVIICKNKEKFNYENARKKLNRSLKHNFYYLGREWPYKNVKPLIVAEEYMQDIESGDLLDYKFLCFNGKVEYLFTCSERFSDDGLKVTFFDKNWNELPFERRYPKSNIEIDKPKNLDKMIKIAEKLSEDIPFVRVDLYENKNKVLFGEFTFFPGSGFEKFEPSSWDYNLGKLIRLF